MYRTVWSLIKKKIVNFNEFIFSVIKQDFKCIGLKILSFDYCIFKYTLQCFSITDYLNDLSIGNYKMLHFDHSKFNQTALKKKYFSYPQ